MRYVLHGEVSSGDEIAELVEFHFRNAVRELRNHPELPDLYSVARYTLDTPGQPEQWLGPRALVEAGGRTDCNNLAIYRAAELVVREGEAARPVLFEFEPRQWHVVVQRADGSVEDPSARSGMLKGREGMTYRDQTAGVGAFRYQQAGEIVVAGVAVGRFRKVYVLRHNLPHEVGAFGDKWQAFWDKVLKRDSAQAVAEETLAAARERPRAFRLPYLEAARLAAGVAADTDEEVQAEAARLSRGA